MSIQPEQPVSIWRRPLQVKFGALAQALGKGAIAGAFGDWPGAASSGVEILNALGLKGNDVGATAWILIQRSLLQAMSELTQEVKTSLNTEAADFRQLCEQLDLVIEESEFSLDRAFFDRPKQLPVVEAMKSPYRRWLQVQGLPELQASSLVERLPGYFVFALSRQWQAYPQDYAPLQTSLSGPFEGAREREVAWQRYSTWLQRKVDEPMFAEVFGLRQIYQPLRAYYERKVRNDDALDDETPYGRSPRETETERVVVDLEATITDWVEHLDRNDAIRVICGGPGCGKSSFGRMMAARFAESQTLPVLFVPLHQFDPSGDLVDSMEAFLKSDLDGILPPNPLTKDNAERLVLIIFDGLDELALQGQVAAQIAQDFVREAQKKLLAFNQTELRVLVMISGREVVVQANKAEFRKAGQILHILPYYQTREDRGKHTYIDANRLLEKDHRQDWWQTYGALKGKPYTSLPEALDQGKLVEITAQPLLNYLVALSYDRDQINFDEESNLNVIYNDLLEQVYQRDWAGYQHPTLGNIEQKDFVRILEEIAIACWHGNGRTTTVGKIADRCAGGNLKRILDIFAVGAQEGVTRLLTAFYFRQSSLQGSEATFEFTHKSFGEYLTARRLVRELRLIQNELTRHRQDPDIGWDEKECLKRWVILCGSTAMDDYLLSFVKDEIKLQVREQVQQWQNTLCHLIGYMLRYGMPMEELEPRPKFIQEIQQFRNASEALLAMLSSCAWVTEAVSNIDWPAPDSFGTWFSSLQGQRTGIDNPVAFSCLNYLNLDRCCLVFRDFYWATLTGTTLDNASLNGSILAWANLEGADLRDANLDRANLEGANLRDANLDRANLEGANLRDANLDGASLDRANLEGANLRDAILYGVSLYKANLYEADLRNADLCNADLYETKLDEAKLDWARFRTATLMGITLDGASLDDIEWNQDTMWDDIRGIETAINVPDKLKQQLGLGNKTHRNSEEAKEKS
jgi:uncharacterized protein YjbI with pentapeptide repeats